MGKTLIIKDVNFSSVAVDTIGENQLKELMDGSYILGMSWSNGYPISRPTDRASYVFGLSRDILKGKKTLTASVGNGYKVARQYWDKLFASPSDVTSSEVSHLISDSTQWLQTFTDSIPSNAKGVVFVINCASATPNKDAINLTITLE